MCHDAANVCCLLMMNFLTEYMKPWKERRRWHALKKKIAIYRVGSQFYMGYRENIDLYSERIFVSEAKNYGCSSLKYLTDLWTVACQTKRCFSALRRNTVSEVFNLALLFLPSVKLWLWPLFTCQPALNKNNQKLTKSLFSGVK